MSTPATRRGPRPGPPAYHRARVAILARLAEGSASIPELEAATGTRGSTLHHHIGVLWMAGRVSRVIGARPNRFRLRTEEDR